jgi:hypothetical protein
MKVWRTLPQRKRSLIGAWCFADHYGPTTVDRSGGMDPPAVSMLNRSTQRVMETPT